MDTALAAMSIALAILGATSATLVAIFIRRGLSPVAVFRLTPRWVTGHDELVVLALEIENLSAIRIVKQAIVLRVREHDPETGLDGADALCRGDDWVTLGSPYVGHPREKAAYRPEGPEEIFPSTVFLNPRETLHAERLYQVGDSGVLHVGLQLRNRFPWWVEQLDRVTRWWNRSLPVNQRSKLSRQQTTTWYVCRDEPGPQTATHA